MTKLLFTLLGMVGIVLAIHAGNPENGVVIKINPAASGVEWTARKVTGKHNGKINLIEGHLEMNDGFLTGGSVTIDMTSIKVLDLQGESAGKLERHLKSDDFFSVHAFPTATLIITESTAKGNAQYDIKADLTIKGITHPVNFNAQLAPLGKAHKGTASITIDRSLYNVKYGSGKFFEGLGDKTIYDEFELVIALVAE